MHSSKFTCRQRLVLLLLVFLAAFILIAGVSFSWFYLKNSLSTVAGVKKPAEIEIVDPGEDMVQMDLSYTENEKDKNGNVTIYRPFMVRSDEPNFFLYLAHTTNIAGMKISIYKADVNGSKGSSLVSGVDADSEPYFWTIDGLNSDYFYLGKLQENNSKVQSILESKNLFTTSEYGTDGKRAGYLNRDSGSADDPIASKQDNLALYDCNFGEYNETTNNVQKNAVPLYWAALQSTNDINSNGKYIAKYILRLSWKETDKETDILYLIAKTSKAQS